MLHRPLLFALIGGLVATGATFVACGGGSASGGVDAGMDSHVVVMHPDVGVTVFETSTGMDAPHTGLPETGSGPDVHIHAHDGGADAPSGFIDAGDAHAIDAPVAACSLVKGSCDIVSQNCSPGSECALVQVDGGLGTACFPDMASEHLAKGAPCCPPSNGSNPCDPGLECNGGNNCSTDAGSPAPGLPPGWGGSRCTPRCCEVDGGMGTANCGTAGDGGAQGHCDLSISFTNGGPSEYSICTYPQTCQPLRGKECLTGFGCEVQNAAGSGQCIVIYNPGGDAGGAGAGVTCPYSNTCADGLACIGASATTTKCQWMCLIAGQAPPFDAGAVTTLGHGGCPTGQTCGGVTGFPAWLGACGP